MNAVLVLGGTTEARRLADRVDVVTSLAGRTSRPTLPRGDVRIGAFGSDAELAAWVRGARALVDATHPFADRITASAAQVCAELGVPFAVLRRPGWSAGPGDRWHRVDSITAAAARVPELGTRVFLTIGRTELAPFASVHGAWFLIRTVEPPSPPLPGQCELLQERGPFSLDSERELLQDRKIDLVVSKDSGGATGAKLTAARELGIPVLLVRRPPLPDVTVLPDVDAVIGWLATVG